MANREVILDAIRNKRCLSGTYTGHYREFCPHVVGQKHDPKKGTHDNVFTFQFGGGSSSGLPVGGQWRCMALNGISDLQVIDAEWVTGDAGQSFTSCVDENTIEAVAEGYSPGDAGSDREPSVSW